MRESKTSTRESRAKAPRKECAKVTSRKQPRKQMTSVTSFTTNIFRESRRERYCEKNPAAKAKTVRAKAPRKPSRKLFYSRTRSLPGLRRRSIASESPSNLRRMTGSESFWALPISNLRFAPHGSQGSLLDCLHPELTGTAGSFLGGGNSPQATGDREEIWSLTCTKSNLLLSIRVSINSLKWGRLLSPAFFSEFDAYPNWELVLSVFVRLGAAGRTSPQESPNQTLSLVVSG